MMVSNTLRGALATKLVRCDGRNAAHFLDDKLTDRQVRAKEKGSKP